jgi:4-azaleucine resistance transporter AzlC
MDLNPANANQDRPAPAEFMRGVRDQIPILLGVAPFGVIFGALAIAAGIPPLETQAFSLLIFAGSAQFISVGLVAEGLSSFLVVLTIFVVNARHVLYSARMAPYYERLSRGWKIALSWLLTDEAFATTNQRYQSADTAYAHWYALGTGLALWTTWQFSTALGIAVGAAIPPDWPLAFALPLTFIALLAPTLIDRPAWAAAAVAGATALALVWLPFKLGLFLAAILGITAGYIVEKRSLSKTEGVQ